MQSPVEDPPSAFFARSGGKSFRENLVVAVAASWGLCAYFPIGVLYLHFLLMLAVLFTSGNVKARVQRLLACRLVWPLVAMLVWTTVVVLVGPWFEDTPTRLFHIVRVAVLVSIGLMLTPAEARAALVGFVVGAVVAAWIISAHRLWGLPDWQIWSSLLTSRNNFSSGNMISMAAASGICLVASLSGRFSPRQRGIGLALAFALALVVATHSVSRNALLLLPVLFAASLLWRFRSLRGRLAGLAVLLTLVALAWQGAPNIQNRFTGMLSDYQALKSTSNYSTSVGARWRMYEEASQVMLKNPVFGTGVGSWLPHWRTVWSGLHQDLSPELERHNAEINNPHNDFLLAGMETGVAGLLILVWLVASFVRAGWQHRSAVHGATLVIGLTILVTGLLNAPFRDAALGMTLLWLLGVSVAAHGKVGRA